MRRVVTGHGHTDAYGARLRVVSTRSRLARGSPDGGTPQICAELRPPRAPCVPRAAIVRARGGFARSLALARAQPTDQTRPHEFLS